MSAALKDLRVLVLGQGPITGLATMIMADFGAQVIEVKPPAGDAFGHLGAAPLWQRGKLTTPLDLGQAADKAQLKELLAGADVLVTNWRPGALHRHQLDASYLQDEHPHLVYCHISGFGSRGPLANMPGYEHLVAAYCGRMQMFQGLVDRPGPVFSALQVGIHACAQAAVAGVLAALFAREANGRGRLVETSLLQGMLPYEQGPMLGTQFRERFPDLLAAIQAPTAEPPMPSLFYHPAQAGDGRWMQFGNLLPHLFDNFLIATDLIDVIADPDFHAKQLLLKDPGKHEAFRERMLRRIQERSAAEWMAQFIADAGIVATAYQTTQEAMADPDIVANGHAIEVADSRQLGPLARLTTTPAQPAQPADPSWLHQWQTSPRPNADIANVAPPLKGVKVLELATIIAAPMGASLLADMGADVIKVEQIGGDPFRGMLSGIGSARVNAGKRSISLNLKSEQGRDIALRLAAQADVVIHNFRPGVPEKLGIAYAQIKAVNPNIIYLQSNGYGPDGPGAMRPSTHPIPGAAMGGVYYQLGERVPTDLQDIEGLRLWTRRLMRANEVNPDPNTAMVVASAVMLGLVARQRNGSGQQILIDMFGANAYANHDDFIQYPGKPPRPMPDTELLGLSPTYQLYACAEQQWIFLAIPSQREQQRFNRVLVDAGLEPIAESVFASNGTELGEALAERLRLNTADHWQQVCIAADVGCVRADGYPPNEFWLRNEQVAAMQLTRPVSHPNWGDYQRHGAIVQFDQQPGELGPPPLAGQHNVEILQQLGFDAEQIATWHDEGVLWQES